MTRHPISSWGRCAAGSRARTGIHQGADRAHRASLAPPRRPVAVCQCAAQLAWIVGDHSGHPRHVEQSCINRPVDRPTAYGHAGCGGPIDDCVIGENRLDVRMDVGARHGQCPGQGCDGRHLGACDQGPTQLRPDPTHRVEHLRRERGHHDALVKAALSSSHSSQDPDHGDSECRRRDPVALQVKQEPVATVDLFDYLVEPGDRLSARQGIAKQRRIGKGPDLHAMAGKPPQIAVVHADGHVVCAQPDIDLDPISTVRPCSHNSRNSVLYRRARTNAAPMAEDVHQPNVQAGINQGPKSRWRPGDQ